MSDASAVPVPCPACVCIFGREHGPGASGRKPESHDVAVVSAADQHGTARRHRSYPPTNYILKLVSSSSSAENNPNLRLSLGGAA